MARKKKSTENPSSGNELYTKIYNAVKNEKLKIIIAEIDQCTKNIQSELTALETILKKYHINISRNFIESKQDENGMPYLHVQFSFKASEKEIDRLVSKKIIDETVKNMSQ